MSADRDAWELSFHPSLIFKSMFNIKPSEKKKKKILQGHDRTPYAAFKNNH